MRLDILDLNSKEGKQRYNEAIEIIDKTHPYYSLEFIDTFSKGLKDAYAYLSLSENGKPLILMPFYYRRIPNTKTIGSEENLFDIVSTYGYSGPLYNDLISEAELREFWSKIDSWHLKNKVVSEFIRFNLSSNYMGYSGSCIATMKNIKGELRDPGTIWQNYEAKVRKNVKRAEREGIVVEVYHQNFTSDIINKFYEIYVHTMKRVNTSKAFYFDNSKIHDFIRIHPNKCAIALAKHHNTYVSAELALLSNNEIFSFLGGTLEQYFKYRPNDLLKHEIIKWGYKNNYSYYVLGGGFGKEDGIYRYKKSFFPNDITTYYTGRKVVNQQYYEQLINSRPNSELSDLGIDKYFPAYRTNDSP